MTGLAQGGKAVASSSYNLYGSTKESTDETENPFAYNGEARDVTGLDYLRARYYDSEAGTFLTEDSYQGELTDPLSQNQYSYVHNNPVNYTDPSGHFWKSIKKAASKAWNGVKKVYNNAKNFVVNTVKSAANLGRQALNWVGAQVNSVRNWATQQWNNYQSRTSYHATPAGGYGGSYGGGSSYAYTQQQQAQQRVQAEQRRQQAVRDEFTQATGIKDVPKSREGQNLLRNWGEALAKTLKHVCDPKTAKGKDDGQKKLDAGRFREIDEASRYGMTPQQKREIDQMSSGELQRRYPFLNQVNPYQGVDATNIHFRLYIMLRHRVAQREEAPKPPSLQDDPSYQYHQSLVSSGIDPATGKKVTPAQILHSRAVMASMVASPFVQSFSLAYNYSAYSKVTSSPKPVTVDVNPVDDVQHSVVGPVKSNIPSVTARFVNYNLADDVLNNHIIARHGSGSTYAHKSKFYSHIDIKSYIDDVLTDPNSLIGPNTKGKTGNIVVKTYSNPMGTDPKGNPVSSIKVVVDPQGNVITAYPIK